MEVRRRPWFEPEPPPWLYAWLAKGSWFHMIYRRFVADLASHLPARARVLDVGTGPGYLLGGLARARPDLDLWGLDFSYGMVRRARVRQAKFVSQEPLTWIVANAQALPFPPRVFDHAMATFSFHIWPQPVTGLSEMKRILKSGGQAWVYELRREASNQDMLAFAREEGLPFLLVYLGLKILSWYHTLYAEDFSRILSLAAANRGHLRPVHHLFWRAELARNSE